MIHRVHQAGPYFAAIAALAGVILFALSGVYTLRQQNHVDERLCDITIENRDSLRAAFEGVREAFLNNIPKNEPAAERAETEARINAFIDRVLQPIPPLECVDNQPVPKEG